MLIGQSPELMNLKKMICHIADTNENVLIIGEAGTGRKLIASEIHLKSKEKNRPFVILNCSAIGDSILDADLFGETTEIRRGIERKIGKLEQANQGILYLDNIHDLKMEYQLKLLNIIKEGKLRKARNGAVTNVTFRVISATSDDRIAVRDTIRKDFLALLSPFILKVPPLRQRKQDICILSCYFLERFSREFNRELPSVPVELYESLMEYEWPGNVLELESTIRNIVQMSPAGQLSLEYLPFEVKRHPLEYLKENTLAGAISEVEKYVIKQTLKRLGGNQTKAARSLKISEATIRYKMKKYGLMKKIV